jgi:PITH domain
VRVPRCPDCNHFSEALATRLGRSGFPRWINAGAKVMHAVGLGGMGAGGQQQAAVDLEGRPLRDSDRQALVMEVAQDVCVDALLDHARVAVLGAHPSHQQLLSIIPVDPSTGARVRLKPAACVRSDADDQLLLYLPFARPVRLVSLLLRLSTSDLDANPRTLRLFVNRPHMDFADAEATAPAIVLEVPRGPPGGRALTKAERADGLYEHVASVDGGRSKFAACTFLTVFVAAGHGAAHTHLRGLTLVGRE